MSTSIGAHSVKVDEVRQRIYLKLEGLMSDEEVTRAADEFIAALSKMKPGFVVINDITRLKVLTQASTLEVKRASEAAVAKGLSVSVRVVGDCPTANMQFNRNAASVGYATATASSAEEAEQISRRVGWADRLLDEEAARQKQRG